MSVSGARPAVDIDLEEFERRLRAAGAPSGIEDPLAELARLVEASRPKGASAPIGPRAAAPPPPPALTAPVAPTAPQIQAAPTPAPVALPPATTLEAAALRPALDEPEHGDHEQDASALQVEGDEPTLELDAERVAAPPPSRHSARWLVTVSALALAGVAMIGGVFALKGRLPGIVKEPPFIAAAVGPTKVQPPSDATVAAPNDLSANLLKEDTQASRVKVVSNEEQPVDLNVQTAPPLSPAPQPAPAPSPAPAFAPPPPLAPAAASSINPPSAVGSVVRGTVDTPLVVAPPPQPAPSPFPEPKPVRTISLRPDGTPIPTPTPEAAASPTPPSEPVQEPPKPQMKPAKAAASDGAIAQSSTPKIELPTKLSGKSSARVAVAKTDTTAPDGAAEAGGQSALPAGGAPAAKPEKPRKAAAAETPAPAEAEPAAPTSGGWAVQLAAPRSEAEAKSVAAKLNEKYASTLGGSALGVHKATVNGETVYRIRVSGLSKADAAALCARLKGDGGECFVAK